MQTNYIWDAGLLTCCLHDGNLVKCKCILRKLFKQDPTIMGFNVYVYACVSKCKTKNISAKLQAIPSPIMAMPSL